LRNADGFGHTGYDKRNNMIRAYMNWSGGKDSSLCLHRVRQEGRYNLSCLLTSMNAAHNRISMHGVQRALLEEQARAVGLPLHTIELPEHTTTEVYATAMLKKVQELKAAGMQCAVFGDIFLEDLRQYREQQLMAAGIEAVFPLWMQDTGELMRRFLAEGFKAIVVCVNEQYLDQSFCGRLIDEDFVRDLPAGTDVCGENGEYHSFVFDGPIFQYPVSFEKGEVVRRTYPAPQSADPAAPKEYGFYFCDLLPPAL
jgi:uncharacterized protein (TIGR00290 family)